MKKFFLFAALMTAAFSCFGANVDAVSAKDCAQHFLQSRVNTGHLNAKAAADLKLALAEPNSSDVTKNAYYIFNGRDSYVIVSGDDRAREVLAYGDGALDVNNIPQNMTGLLLLYKRQIEYLQANPGLKVQAMLNAPKRSIASVSPMLTCNWDQDVPYYNQCPTYYGSNCLTGCPATSLSMVFYYWKYPTDETPAVESYVSESYDFTVEALPPITFDWDNMLDSYLGSYTTAQADAVAWLMRYIGQEEQMDYTPSGSGAMGADILRAVNFFGYDSSTSELIFKAVADDNGNETEYIDDATWATMLQTELEEGRPVVYCAYDYDSWSGWSGHAFNVDGYDASNDTYHVNFGWSGSGNGYYALNAFSYSGYTFNIEQQMIRGIQPPAASTALRVTPSTLDMEAYPGHTATATFDVKGSLLEGDITLTLNDANGVFALDANRVSLSESEQGKTITVTYAPRAAGNYTATVTVSSPGVADKTVTLNGTSVLEVYKPVLLPADSAFINLTQFRADWTDATPAENVASYTLEVRTKPETQLLEDVDWTYLTTSANVSSSWQNYLPSGWSLDGTSLWSEIGGISLGVNTSIITPEYDLAGYDKVTIVVESKRDGSRSSKLTIATSMGSEVIMPTSTAQTYTIVLDCSEADAITFTGVSYPHIHTLQIYAGELDEVSLRASESGDAGYRLIENITPDKFYTVTGLEAGGTYVYKVKALYIDGTNSGWSKSKSVTLFENGHGYEAGDVNHDGSIDPGDISALIEYMLSDFEVCTICADVNNDGSIDPGDISALIDMLLNN